MAGKHFLIVKVLKLLFLIRGMKALIDSGNLELIQVLLEKTDFVTKKNIDKFIQYAIDTKQQ